MFKPNYIFLVHLFNVHTCQHIYAGINEMIFGYKYFSIKKSYFISNGIGECHGKTLLGFCWDQENNDLLRLLLLFEYHTLCVSISNAFEIEM